MVWHASQIQSLDDARRRVTRICSTGAGFASEQLPAFYNNVLSIKFQIVFGYPGGVGVELAMERGEVEGRGANPYFDYMSEKPEWIPKKLIRPLIQVGMVKEPALPDVPLLREQLVRDEDKLLLGFVSRAVTVGRPLVTTPGTPVEWVAVLRKASHGTRGDPEFVADSKRQNAELRPMSGEELAKLYRDLIGAPHDVKDRVNFALDALQADALEMSRGSKSAR